MKEIKQTAGSLKVSMTGNKFWIRDPLPDPPQIITSRRRSGQRIADHQNVLGFTRREGPSAIFVGGIMEWW